MTIDPVIQLYAFIVIFGLLATFVEECRKTSILILAGTIINLALLGNYNFWSDQGEIMHLAVLALFDLVLGFAIFDMGDDKRIIQASLLGVAVIFHCVLGIELIMGEKYFIIFPIYEELIQGINILQIITMWGCYVQLCRNIKRLSSNDIFYRLFSFNRVRLLFGNTGMGGNKKTDGEVT